MPKREAQLATAAFREKIAGIFSGSARLAPVATRVAAKLEIKEVGPVLQKLLADKQQQPQTRVEALDALARLEDPKLPKAMELAIEDSQAEVRVAGRRVLIADAVPGAADRAVAAIRDRVKAQVAKGRLSVDPDALDLTAVESVAELAGR